MGMHYTGVDYNEGLENFARKQHYIAHIQGRMGYSMWI